MSPTEVENLVVRLSGDSSGLQKELRHVSGMVKSSAKELESEAARLTNKLKTGTEQHADRVRHLDRMLRAGAISQQTYGRAVADSERQIRRWNDAQEEGSNFTQISSRRLNFFGLQLRAFGSEAAAALVPVLALWHGVKKLSGSVQLAAEFEAQQTKMEVMLKSAEKAKTLMEDLERFASKTPLGQAELVPVANQLLQAGFEMEALIPTIRMLGDAVMGDAESLQRVAKQFTDVKKLGRLLGEELNVMSEAGFDAMEALEQTTGKTRQQLMKMKEAGKITFDMLNKAMTHATGPMGRFHNGMEKASTTFKGLSSTVKDSANIFRRQVGADIIEILRLKDALRALDAAINSVSEAYKGLSPEIKKTSVALAGVATSLFAVNAVWPVMRRLGPPVLASVFGSLARLVNPLVHLKTLISGLGLLVSRSPLGMLGRLIGVGLGAVLTGFVRESGGVTQAVQRIGRGLEQLLAWTKPIRQAVASLFRAFGEGAGFALAAVGRMADQAYARFKALFSGVEIDWGRVQTAIVKGVLFLEYTFRNMGQVWEFTWLSIKLAAVSVVNFLLNNVFVLLSRFFLGPVGLLVSLFVAFKETFTKIGRFVGDVFLGLIADITDFMSKVWDALSGKTVDWSGLFKGVKSAVGDLTLTGTGIKVEGLQKLEDQIRKEWEEARNRLGEDFDAFYKRRMEEFAKQGDAAAKQAVTTGANIAKGMAGGLDKESKREDAILLRSAEARARVLEQRYRLMARDKDGNPLDPAAKNRQQFADKQKANLDAYRVKFGSYKPVGQSWSSAYPGVPLKGQLPNTVVMPPPPPAPPPGAPGFGTPGTSLPGGPWVPGPFGSPAPDPSAVRAGLPRAEDLPSYGKPESKPLPFMPFWDGDEKDPRYRYMMEEQNRKQTEHLRKIEEYLRKNNVPIPGAPVSVAPADLQGI